MAWFWDFAWMKKFVFFFCMERSFFWLPRDDVTQSLWMSTFAVNGSCCSLECCFIADDENCCRDLLVGTAEVQKPWFLLPCNKRTVFEIFDFKMSWPWNPGQRSLKVTGTDMDRSATYDFLLTLHSNHEPISHRFRDKFTAISVDKKISYRGQTARRV